MKTSVFRHIALAATLATTAFASAQSLDESVTVEGTYRPEIIPADRLPLVPDLLRFSAPESRMQFDQNPVSANFAPDALTMPSTDWRVRKNYSATRGYLDFRLGSWLNSSLSAGYAPIRNDATTLNVWLQHCSTSLWREKWEAEGTKHEGPKRFRYDETIGADLSHRFAGAGRLDADLRYHLGYFNYYMLSSDWIDNLNKIPTQTLNDASVNLRWEGRTYGKYNYEAYANVRYFGYRRMYELHGNLLSSQTPAIELLQTTPDRETSVNAGGNLRYAHNGCSSWQADLGYSGVINSLGSDVNRLQITPAYLYTQGNTALRVGVKATAVDSKFRIAPDVVLTYSSGILALKAAVGGGTHLRTLAWMHDLAYYSDPQNGCHRAAYTPVDARLAFQLNPGGRWTSGIEGYWHTTKDERTVGFYGDRIFFNLFDIPGDWMTENLHGFSLAVNAGYDFCKEFSVKGNATWQPQHDNTGVLNGFDRPEFTANLSACSSPIEKLSVRLDYNLRARRYGANGDVHLLNLNADYRITDRISVGAELNNLLNRRHQLYGSDVEIEGFNFAVGAQLTF